MSHDLRTPLAAIVGASSSLLDESQTHEATERRELLQSIVDESKRLARLVDNLLDMTRLEAGIVALNKQWHVLEEIVGSARSRLRRELANHRVQVDIPGDLPLLSVDGLLLEQVLVNLLENAARYTPAGSQIQIAAKMESRQMEIRVSDNGTGLPNGAESRVFEKFFAAHRQQRPTVVARRTWPVHLQGDHSSPRRPDHRRNRPEGAPSSQSLCPAKKRPSVVLDELATTTSS